jgi:hypothetical protein
MQRRVRDTLERRTELRQLRHPMRRNVRLQQRRVSMPHRANGLRRRVGCAHLRSEQLRIVRSHVRGGFDVLQRSVCRHDDGHGKLRRVRACLSGTESLHQWFLHHLRRDGRPLLRGKHLQRGERVRDDDRYVPCVRYRRRALLRGEHVRLGLHMQQHASRDRVRLLRVRRPRPTVLQRDELSERAYLHDRDSRAHVHVHDHRSEQRRERMFAAGRLSERNDLPQQLVLRVQRLRSVLLPERAGRDVLRAVFVQLDRERELRLRLIV